MFRVPRSIDVYTAQHVLMHDSPKMLKIYKILGFDSDSHPGLTSLTISANLEKNITIGYQEHEGEVQTVLVEDEDYEKRLEVLNLLYPQLLLNQIILQIFYLFFKHRFNPKQSTLHLIFLLLKLVYLILLDSIKSFHVFLFLLITFLIRICFALNSLLTKVGVFVVHENVGEHSHGI